MLEDQVTPKRCGHTRGKSVVGRQEAYNRIRAAVDARAENQDIVILARTDARATDGLDEAIERCRMFRELGADITFLEAPQSVEEMELYCRSVDGPKLANMLEGGVTPILSPADLQRIGYRIAAYPTSLLSASVKVMDQALQNLRNGKPVEDLVLPFASLRAAVGFDDYFAAEEKYKL
jgi:2-methylisocitrate lyase-like PEP mutase family enzyme